MTSAPVASNLIPSDLSPEDAEVLAKALKTIERKARVPLRDRGAPQARDVDRSPSRDPNGAQPS